MTQRGVPQRIRYRYFGAGGRKKRGKDQITKKVGGGNFFKEIT